MLDGRFGFKCATFANAEAKLKTMVTTAHGYVATQPSGLGVVLVEVSVKPPVTERRIKFNLWA
jgi:hypothetical protein